MSELDFIRYLLDLVDYISLLLSLLLNLCAISIPLLCAVFSPVRRCSAKCCTIAYCLLPIAYAWLDAFGLAWMHTASAGCLRPPSAFGGRCIRPPRQPGIADRPVSSIHLQAHETLR